MTQSSAARPSCVRVQSMKYCRTGVTLSLCGTTLRVAYPERTSRSEPGVPNALLRRQAHGAHSSQAARIRVCRCPHRTQGACGGRWQQTQWWSVGWDVLTPVWQVSALLGQHRCLVGIAFTPSMYARSCQHFRYIGDWQDPQLEEVCCVVHTPDVLRNLISVSALPQPMHKLIKVCQVASCSNRQKAS